MELVEAVSEAPMEVFKAYAPTETPPCSLSRPVLYRDTIAGSCDTRSAAVEETPPDDEALSDGEEDEADDDPLCPVIRLTNKEKEELRRPWRQALIVKVWGKQVGYSYLHRRLSALWRPKGTMDLVALDNEYYLVKFSSVDDLDYAKYEGPWIILNHYLIVKEWTPDFDPMTDKMEKVLVWIRFSCLPIEYYNPKFLQRIGKKVERPIRVDHATGLALQGKFARMCVEIDLFRLRKRMRFIAYEGIHLVCFNCGMYDHNHETCLKENTMVFSSDAQWHVCHNHETCLKENTMVFSSDAQWQKGKADEADGSKLTTGASGTMTAKPRMAEDKAPFGSWMLVTWETKRPGARAGQNGSRRTAGDQSRQTQSRFLPLEVVIAEDADPNAAPGAWCRGKGIPCIFKNLIKTYRPDVLGLVEPKLSGYQVSAICSKMGYEDWVRVEVVGFSGGIWVLWNKPIEISVLYTPPQFILIQVNEDGATPWNLAVVYASPAHHLRKRLWNELQAQKREITGPWMAMGDFNAVVCKDETFNYMAYSQQRSMDFVDWIHMEGLVDLGFSGPRFTWMRGVEGTATKGARLDRALCDVGWRDVFGSIEVRKINLLARIGGVQQRLANAYHGGLSKLEKVGKRVVRGRIAIDAAGNWITELIELQRHVTDFYVNLFKDEEGVNVTKAATDLFPMLGCLDWRWFNRDVTKEEIRKVVIDMSPLKAPRPDGFHAAFYQRSWEVVGDGVYELVKTAFDTGCLPEGINDTLLVLILKVAMPENIKQFRPISLCNVSYKIITKTITNRFKTILPKLIGPYQSSFVLGRQISENIIIYQEVMHTMRTRQGNKGLMAIKIDLEKAYDRLSWDFINNSILDAGFSDGWVWIIMQCVSTANMQIIWNGTRMERFKPGRGIRQSDAMSPALFVLCPERLSQSISLEVERGTWKGIRLSTGGPTLSHMCFADDMVIFSEASLEQVAVIKQCLDRYCEASGQKISLGKSQVFFSRNTGPVLQDTIATELGIPPTADLGRYLGVPSLHGRTTCATLAGLLDRVATILDGWRSKVLTFAGRVTLAKSVLNAIPTYTMQTAILPKGVCTKLETITRRFIWGGDSETRRTSLVNWETVKKRKGDGGLGIRSLQDVNMAFVAKLCWRMRVEHDSMWTRVLSTKYDTVGGRRQTEVYSTASNAWQGIQGVTPALERGLTRIVRNGRTTRFWMDIWTHNQRLLRLDASASIPETLDHMFRRCPEVAGFWELLLPHNTAMQLMELGWDEWLSTNLGAHKRNDLGEDWPVTLGISMWWNWRWRNDRVFAGRRLSL
ncbi:PREDICTED: uncharacterized protein LOC109193862 [Ipomoea nil]|uniref:uncharacterized protein LOC109193862 n=1 Tax=Ipomoea nil TaxID=35883 RepID=UPI0009018CE3|nr:PREDICTED: uncharacterized protein LOC109193862 [Ipomoea nil]